MRIVRLFSLLAVMSAGAGTAWTQAPSSAQSVGATNATCKDVLTELSKRWAEETAKLAKLEEKENGKAKLLHDAAQKLGTAEILGLCLSEDSTVASQYVAKLREVTERDRVDKQVGASSGGGGSTSAVSGASTPALVGLALETGAVSRSVNGSTVTYRTTPAKVIAALAKVYGEDPPSKDPVYNALGRLDLGVSFTTTGNSSASSNSGTTLQAFFRQVAEVSARFEILNHRDVFSKYAFDKFTALRTSKESQNYLKSAGGLFSAIYGRVPQATKEAYGHWYTRRRDEVAAQIADGKEKSEKDIHDLVSAYFADLAKNLDDDANFKAALDKFIDSWVIESRKEKEIYGKIAKSPILTFEYALDRPPMVVAQTSTSTAPPTPTLAPPDVHNARLIFAARFIGNSEYTLNASSGFFRKSTPDMKGHWRDVQFGAKLDIPLPNIAKVGKGTLTFSGLYVHLHQRPLGISLKINDILINQPGSIRLFQAKYTIPLGDSGVSVPLSLTASNRTELIKESKVRGHLGITFDLDKLFTKAKK